MPDLAFDLAPTDDDRLDQAEALVRAYCGWHISPEVTETVTLRGRCERALTLPSLYVTEIASITDGVTDLTDETDYTWSRGGVILREGFWSRDVITVEFTHGYETPPADVVAVVQAVAQRAVNNPGSLTRRQIGPFADSYSLTGPNEATAIALLASERSALDPYRIVPVS